MATVSSSKSSSSPSRRAAARDAVFQISVHVEPQLPDVEEELKKWRLGDATRDAKQRALSRHQSRANLAADLAAKNYGAGDASSGTLASLRVDTIRLSAAPDQQQLNRFVALHTPPSLHEKQLTNFEVRRLIQRTRGRPAYVVESTSALLPDENDGGGEISLLSPSRRRASRVALEEAFQQQDEAEKNAIAAAVAVGSQSSTPRPSKEGKQRESKKPAVLEGLGEKLMARAGNQLNQMIREAARARSDKMPLPGATDRSHKQSAGGSKPSSPGLRKASPAAGKGAGLRHWYHSLGLEPPAKKAVPAPAAAPVASSPSVPSPPATPTGSKARGGTAGTLMAKAKLDTLDENAAAAAATSSAPPKPSSNVHVPSPPAPPTRSKRLETPDTASAPAVTVPVVARPESSSSAVASNSSSPPPTPTGSKKRGGMAGMLMAKAKRIASKEDENPLDTFDEDAVAK